MPKLDVPRGLDDVGLQRFLLRDKRLHASLREAVQSVGLRRTILGASTLTATLRDHEREIIRSKLVNHNATIGLDGLFFDYVAYRKAGDSLTLEFEASAVADLRKIKGPRKAAPGTTTRTRFAGQIVGRVKYLKFRAEPGDRNLIALTQGKNASGWKTLQDLASKLQWRCFETENVIYFGSDKWLTQIQRPFVISEDDEGIDSIDPEYDGGRRSTRCTVSCWMNRWAARPGAPVYVRGLGELATKDFWIVETIDRPNIFSKKGTVTLVRKTPALPEPLPESDPRNRTTAEGGIVRIGREIEALGRGFVVSEGPGPFGPIGKHGTNSWHYKGLAIDVNWRGGGGFSSETQALAWLAKWILDNVDGIVELFHPGRDPDGNHGTHLHLAISEDGGFLVRQKSSSSGSPKGKTEVKQELKSAYKSIGREDLAKLVDHKDFDDWVDQESGWDFGIVSEANNQGKVNGGGFQFWAGHAWAVPYFTRGVRTSGDSGNRFTMSVEQQAIATVRHFGLTVAEVHRYGAQIRAGTYRGWG